MLKRIEDALDAYTHGYYALKSVVDEYPDYFPLGAISCGTFAEFYCKVYLQHRFPNAVVEYGKSGSQKGWDLLITHADGVSERCQVKSTSEFAKRLMVSRPTTGFDQLFVIVLDAGFNVVAAYVFVGETAINQLKGSGRLSVPDKKIPARRGSENVFRHAKDISDDFFDALADRL